MNTKKLAGLIYEIAFHKVTSVDAALGGQPWTFSDVRTFAKDLSAAISMQLPELLAECAEKCTCTYNLGDGVHVVGCPQSASKKRLAGMTFDQYKSMTDQCMAAVKSSIVGLESGE